MRVLTVGSLPPEWGGRLRGGAATFHAALLSGLAGRVGIEVVGVLPPEPLQREIPVPVFPRPDDVPRARHYEELLERLRPDVVLMNHFAHTIGATHAQLGSPVPAVGVAQSWHSIAFAAGGQREGARELTQEALDGLAALVAVSRHGIEEGRELGLRYPALVEAIHNPVPPLHMEHAGLAERRRAGVVFLGGLIGRKRPGLLLEAALRMPSLDVTLIGSGELEEELRARISALGLRNRVQVAEAPRGDRHLPWVRDALLGAKAMCLPSRSEGLPLAFVEALACGTPIVGFGPAVREIREELEIDVGEPVDGDEPEELAAALERVLERDWDRAALRQATLERFGLARIVGRYVDLFERLLDRAPAGAGAKRPGAMPAGSASTGLRGTAICVLGSSRSGTSLTTRLLGLAGVYLGPDDELLGEELSQLAGEGDEVLAKASDSNPGGHWEHYRLMRLNERILQSMGGSWRDPPPLPAGWEAGAELDGFREEARVLLAGSFSGRALWGWKDPRSSLTLPFWRKMLPEMRCVICLRHPLEVAESLRERDSISIDAGVTLWTRYLASALVNTAGCPRLLVRYEDYFRDPAAVVARLTRWIGGESATRRNEELESSVPAIDAGLWRHRLAGGHSTSVPLPGDAAPLLRVAELLTLLDTAGESSDGLDAAADRFAVGVLRRLAQPVPTLASV